MDFQSILSKIKAALISFWHWIKPYLGRFHRWRKRIWKKYHINKLILLIGLICVLIVSIYLFILAKQANVSTLKSKNYTNITFYKIITIYIITVKYCQIAKNKDFSPIKSL